MISKIIGAAILAGIILLVVLQSAKVLGWRRALRAMGEGAGCALLILLAAYLLFSS